MPPYLTLTTAKVKIKFPSYFFPNSHGWDRKFHFEKVSNKLHCYLSVKLTECFPAKPSGSSGKLMRLLQYGSSWNFINQFWHAKYFTTYCIFFRSLISQQPCSNQWHDPICFPVSSSCLQLRQFCKSKFLKTIVNWTFVSELHDIFIFPMNSCHLETYKDGAPMLKWTLGSTAKCKRGVSIIPSRS